MKKRLNTLFGVILLAVLVCALLYLLSTLKTFYINLNTTIQASVATGAALIIVASITYYANKSVEFKKSTEQAMRPKKIELYEEFIAFFMRVLGNEKYVEKPSEDEIIEFFIKLTPVILVYGSNSVIEKWGKLRIKLAENTSTDNMFVVEDLFKEIRKDLGHNKLGSSKGNILRLFINDIDEYI